MHSGGKKSFQTPNVFLMDCIVLRAGLKSPSAAYFSALSSVYPHAACALMTSLAAHPEYRRKELGFLVFSHYQ